MPSWDIDYLNDLKRRFAAIQDGLQDRIEGVVRGRVAPAVDAIPIGSGRAVRAAVLFFDIRHYKSMTGSAEPNDLKRTLVMLDCVIPMVMHVIHDHDGYVEKNTGDGVMGIFGVDRTDAETANAALDAATTIFFVLQHVINPALAQAQFAAVQARIGIDLGNVLLARIGVPSGTARQDRNFLTAVGPAANLASKLQGMAGTDEIWVGSNVAASAAPWRQQYFLDVTPQDWPWTFSKPWQQHPYRVWEYSGRKRELRDDGALRRLLGLQPPK